jgi:hypothetical protein
MILAWINFLVFLVVLEFEPRASHLLDRDSTTWATLPDLFVCVCVGYFWDRVSNNLPRLALNLSPPDLSLPRLGIVCCFFLLPRLLHVFLRPYYLPLLWVLMLLLSFCLQNYLILLIYGVKMENGSNSPSCLTSCVLNLFITSIDFCFP